ncbi:MAG: polyamine aminopropyltransferase [Gammaproteobacteria bacterium]|nr:polyamine aminopropyltransferase [Gammaproteobacteria bacterium]
MSLTDSNWYVEEWEDGNASIGLRLAEAAKVHEEQSPYQKIAIYDTVGFGRLMTIDGLVMLTSRDNFIYHEMMSHPALYAHPNPKRVVIIGGGDCGTLREVLKHPGVEHCLQVDIDERVTRISEMYFPELCDANSDERAELAFIDGVKWMEEVEPGSVDVIIVDSTDPVGFAEGLFKIEFFKTCLRALADPGVMVQQSESPLFHSELIAGMHKNLKLAGFDAVSTLNFPQCTYPSGWWSCTMAGKGVDPAKPRLKDAARKEFVTRYYHAELHRGALAIPQFLMDRIAESPQDTE